MTDGREAEDKLDPDLAGGAGDAQAAPPAPVADPWASAFASLEDTPAADTVGDTPEAAGEPAGAPVPTAVDTGAAPTAEPGTGDAAVGAGDDGGDVPAAPVAGDSDGAGALEDIPAQIEQYSTEIEQRAINETAQLFLERTNEQGQKLIRQTNGQLGATISDPDIYRVDDQGVPTFYNPDTGRPFTGDNPRAQAKQWVEAYNEELRDTFNRLAEARTTELQTEMAPVIELLKFTPTYEKLDPVRQQMLDALIEDYEVYDSANNHVGYSIDLNKALDRVNKQVAAIQASRQAAPAAPVEPAPPTGPALDMPTTGGGGTPGKAITSLAEAMEAQQDAELEKLKK